MSTPLICLIAFLAGGVLGTLVGINLTLSRIARALEERNRKESYLR